MVKIIFIRIATFAILAAGAGLSFLSFIGYVLVKGDCPTCSFSAGDWAFLLAGPVILLLGIIYAIRTRAKAHPDGRHRGRPAKDPDNPELQRDV